MKRKLKIDDIVQIQPTAETLRKCILRSYMDSNKIYTAKVRYNETGELGYGLMVLNNDETDYFYTNQRNASQLGGGNWKILRKVKP